MSELLSRRGKGRANINSKDKAGFTALMMASEKNAAPIVTDLIARGADVNLTTTTGFTAIATAAKCGSDACVRILAGNGAELERTDMAYGCTPLMWACQYCTPETVTDLCARRPRLESKSRFGTTALMMAVEANKLDTVKALLAAGALARTKDTKGRSAVTMARDKGMRGILEVLLAAEAAEEAAVGTPEAVAEIATPFAARKGSTLKISSAAVSKSPRSLTASTNTSRASTASSSRR